MDVHNHNRLWRQRSAPGFYETFKEQADWLVHIRTPSRLSIMLDSTFIQDRFDEMEEHSLGEHNTVSVEAWNRGQTSPRCTGGRTPPTPYPTLLPPAPFATGAPTPFQRYVAVP